MNVFGKLAAVLLVCSICASASAGVISYGDYDVTTAKFLGIQESGIEVSPGVTEPLYGAPTPADNSLLFNPVNFGVMSSGLGSDLCDGTLSATITADQGYGIDGIGIFEAGDYAFAGVGTSATSVAVTVSGFISILEIDGQAVNPLDSQYTINFSKNLLSANLVDNGILGNTWSGDVIKDFDNLDGAVTKLSINIDNTLTANSEAGTAALLMKKQFQLKAFTSDTIEVPEPSTLVLLGLGALSLLYFRRK